MTMLLFLMLIQYRTKQNGKWSSWGKPGVYSKKYQNVESTNKLAIIHDNYITLYQDDKAVANLVYMNGKYLFLDADVEIQKLKRNI